MTIQGSSASKLKILQPETLISGCKINLYLEITGILPNGYHELVTLMLPLASPCDTLRVFQGRRDGLEFVCSEKFIDPLNNTLQKAYDLYRLEAPCLPDLRVELAKGVPHGAGLGGGSADAAALLLFLDRCLATAGFAPLGRENLLRLAARVGADVPFFILGSPAWATGIGEKLAPTPVPGSFRNMHLVLVCPDINISTSRAYAAWDEGHAAATSSRSRLTSKTSQATYFPSADFGIENLFNSFEDVVFSKYPELRKIKQQLLDLGASGALMSGSGSSVFGLYRQAETAAAAHEFFTKSGFQVYLEPIHAGASPSW